MNMRKVLALCLLVAGALTSFGAPAIEGLTDPTRPLHYASGGDSYLDELKKKYILNSVIVSDQRRVAVINGKRVKEGDRVRNALVSRIAKSQVTLVIDGTRVDIHLSSNNFKHY